MNIYKKITNTDSFYFYKEDNDKLKKYKEEVKEYKKNVESYNIGIEIIQIRGDIKDLYFNNIKTLIEYRNYLRTEYNRLLKIHEELSSNKTINYEFIIQEAPTIPQLPRKIIRFKNSNNIE